MTYGEILEQTIERGYQGVNNTCNEKCTKCGECCGHILPIDEKDIEIIYEYVLKNNIKINKTILIMQNKLQCPYYTGNREKGCSIYEARPKICQYYKCDKKMISKFEFSKLKECKPIDMWSLANTIESEVMKSESDKKTRKTIK